MVDSGDVATLPRVLHVVECLGGGVEATLTAWIKHTPMVEHGLLYATRDGDGIGSALPDQVQFARMLPRNLVAARRSLISACTSFRPHMVHAHSSVAGVVTRSVRRRAWQSYYTPHGYAFQRTDVPAIARNVFLMVERFLARWHDGTVAIGIHEEHLARSRVGCPRVVVVPNVSAVGDRQPRAAESNSQKRVVTVGRITSAKGPGFFAEAVRQARQRAPDVAWIWIGGGDSASHAELEAAGVHVTGWLTQAEALQRMAAADVYVHTAEWEGCPSTVLDALELGLPVVGRRVPALQRLGLRVLADTPSDLADLALTALGPERSSDYERQRTDIRALHSHEEQAARLRHLYGAGR